MSYLKLKSLFFTGLLAISITFSTHAIVHAEDIDDTSAVNDPFEKANRFIYSFNMLVDGAVIKPVAKGYRYAVPKLAREGVHNVLTNLSEPVTMINSIFQGDQQNSFSAFWRFMVNTTFGMGGLFDVAKDAGLYNRKEDFGQTAGIYDADQGPYLMLPILGPSNARDAFGKVVDVFIDPFNYILTDETLLVEAGVNGLDKREATLDLTKHIDETSLDPYATIRSLYTQKRFDEINNGKKK